MKALAASIPKNLKAVRETGSDFSKVKSFSNFPHFFLQHMVPVMLEVVAQNHQLQNSRLEHESNPTPLFFWLWLWLWFFILSSNQSD